MSDGEWEFHLRSLSAIARDSNFANDPASDPSLLNSVNRLCELCKNEKSEDLIARVYPHLSKIFQRSLASISQSRSSIGTLLLAILQFFLYFGDVVLHDADPSLRTFFRSCLSRSSSGCSQNPDTVNWKGGSRKMIAHIPFYILGEQEGPPVHDLSFSDILPRGQLYFEERLQNVIGKR